MDNNVPEFDWLEAFCRHQHEEDEWKPRWIVDQFGKEYWYYPSQHEAEYTAWFAFQVAVAISYWAMRVGVAKLQLHRTTSVRSRRRVHSGMVRH